MSDVSLRVTAQDMTQAALGSIKGALDSVASAGKNLAGIGGTLTQNVTAPLLGLAATSQKAALDHKKLLAAFQSSTGSAEQATAAVKSINDMAARSSIPIEQFSNAGKKLLAFNVPAKDVSKVLKEMGDISAGTGVSLEDLSATYGKVAITGKVSLKQLTSLGQQGIPITQALAQAMGITEDQVLEMVKAGKVGLPEFQKAMEGLTSEGGRFANGMEEKTGTIQGFFGALQNNVTESLEVVGASIAKTVNLGSLATVLLDWIIRIREGFTSFIETHPGFAKIAVIIGVVAAALGPVLTFVGMLMEYAPLLATGLGAVGAVLGFLISPLGLLVAGIAALVYFNFDAISGFANEVLGRIGAATPFASSALHELWAQLTGIGLDSDGTTEGIYNFVAALTGSNDMATTVSNAVSDLGYWLGNVQEKVMAVVAVFKEFGGGALAEVVAQLTGFGQSADDTTNIFQKLLTALGMSTETASAVGEGLKIIGDVTRALGPLFLSVAETLGSAFGAQLATTFDLLLTTIRGVGQIIVAVFSGDWAGAIEGAKTVLGGLGTYAIESLVNLGGLLTGFAAGLLDFAANVATNLGFPELGKSIEDIKGKLTAGWLSIKDSVTIAVQNFKWSDFIAAFTWDNIVTKFDGWATYVKSLDWATYIKTALAWADWIAKLEWKTFLTVIDWSLWLVKISWAAILPGVINWGEWLVKLDWTKIITTAIDWAVWLTVLPWNILVKAIDWSVWIGKLAWTDWLSKIDWTTHVKPLTWSDFVADMKDWATYIKSLDWGGYITKIVSWEAWLDSLIWSAFVKNVELPTFVKAIDWTGFVTKLTGWADFIVKVAWSDYIAPKFKWAEWVTKIAWLDWIAPKFAWLDFIAKIAWADWIAPKFSWDAFITSLDLPSLIPKWPGWGAIFSEIGLGGDDAPKTPGGWTGIGYTRAGLHWVGERGPELVDMSAGSRIYSASESLALANGGSDGGGGVNLTIHASLASDMDVNVLAYQILDIIRSKR